MCHYVYVVHLKSYNNYTTHYGYAHNLTIHVLGILITI